MIIRTHADIQKALDLLDTCDTWSTDVETSSLNHRTGKLIGFGCANPVDYKGFYIIMREWVGGALIDVLTEADVKPVVEKLATKKLLGWNFAFDASWFLFHFGINLMRCLHAEVMLMVHVCDENKFQYGLKAISAEIFGASAVTEQTDMLESIKANGGGPKDYYKADSTLMAKYGIQDNVLTCKNYNYWSKILKQEGLEKFYYEDEVVPLMKNVTFQMQYRGVPVDVEAMKAANTAISADLEALEDQIQTLLKPYLEPFHDWFIQKHFPFSFTPRFKAALGARMAPAQWPLTKTGTYSFAKADLDRAIKRGLINETSDFYLYATQQKVPSTALIREIQLELFSEEGTKYAFNLLSTDHLKRLFFKQHGGPLAETALSFTPKGAPQINDAFLEAMAVKYSWAALLQDYRSLTKLKGTYIERFLDEQENGVFYPSFLQHRTTTGRLGGSLQQLPRVKSEEEINSAIVLKYTNMIRSFFVSLPGHKLVDADYASLEVVVFADDSQDPALMKVITDGLDLYSQVAINAYGLQGYSADKKAPNFLKNHKPELRQAAKAFALGFRYNLQPYKLSKDLKISEQEAQRIYQNYFRSFPVLKKRMDVIIAEAKETGAVTSAGGRKRRVPELKQWADKYGDMLFDGLELWKEYHDQPATYAAMKQKARVAKNLLNACLNHPIQSMAASIVSKASIAVAKELEARNMQSYICLNVHDELCLHCPDSEVVEASAILQDKMENTTKLSLPLQAEPIVGSKYSDVK